ncbi:tetratricopeptide repeat protein [Sinorhizobium sp. 8-89]|uniref:tetratricopeptide repeat protein n=1 Tax=Sinorhizobium sp. 8-89 TaxID=3049089 RepID=UPI002867B52C|nr:tetratricopeptide repeat protein [Sinorhizobium sp. 8-89]
MRWFERASLAGDDVAAFNLAVMLDEGTVVPEDNLGAAKFYGLAAQRGNVDAMVNLGLMFESGEGVRRNPAAAQELFRQAADRGDPLGQQKLDPIATGSVIHAAMVAKMDRPK